MKVNSHIKRNAITTIITLAFFWTIAEAQSTDSTINYIEVKYNEIRSHITAYDTTKTDIWGESTDGGQAIAYRDKDKDIKLIEVTWFGESGKSVTEYYFDEEKLIFAFDKDFEYNRPYYWDEKKAKEMGDTEVFDPRKTKIKEDRYYFKSEKLFLWLDNAGKSVDLKAGTNTLVGQGLIAHAYRTRDESNKSVKPDNAVSFVTIFDLRNATKDGYYINGYVVNIDHTLAKKINGKRIRVNGTVTIVKGLGTDPAEYDQDGNKIISQGRDQDTKHIFNPAIDVLE